MKVYCYPLIVFLSCVYLLINTCIDTSESKKCTLTNVSPYYYSYNIRGGGYSDNGHNKKKKKKPQYWTHRQKLLLSLSKLPPFSFYSHIQTTCQPDSKLPYVSIIIPCYNEVLNRNTDIFIRNLATYTRIPNVELVLVDGGSTDTTLHIIEFFQKRYRYRFFYCLHDRMSFGKNINIKKNSIKNKIKLIQVKKENNTKLRSHPLTWIRKEIMKTKRQKVENKKIQIPLSRGKLLQYGANSSSGLILLFHHPRSMIDENGIEILKNLSQNLFLKPSSFENSTSFKLTDFMSSLSRPTEPGVLKILQKSQHFVEKVNNNKINLKRQRNRTLGGFYKKNEVSDEDKRNLILLWGAFTHRFLSSSCLPSFELKNNFLTTVKDCNDKENLLTKELKYPQEIFVETTNFLLNFTSWWSNNIRGDLMGIYYLDHCLFCSKDLYSQLPHGFPPLPIFEDTEFCKAIHKVYQNYRKKQNHNIQQQRIVLIPQLRFKKSLSLTSDIRFRKNGILKQISLNQLLKLKYFWNQYHISSRLENEDTKILSSPNNDAFSRMNRIYERGLKLNNVN